MSAGKDKKHLLTFELVLFTVYIFEKLIEKFQFWHAQTGSTRGRHATSGTPMVTMATRSGSTADAGPSSMCATRTVGDFFSLIVY